LRHIRIFSFNPMSGQLACRPGLIYSPFPSEKDIAMVHAVNDRSWVEAFYDSAADWWGESWYEGENLQPRLKRVERWAGQAPKRLLELGAGTGETAAFLAAAGYQATAVDISHKNFAFLAAAAQKCPNLTPVRGDFYTAQLSGNYDAVCLFECFGMGSDADQRQLLARISAEWLAPGGVVIMDVYHPFGPIRRAGEAYALDRLENVTGSEDMTERTYYDAVLGRWIDEWEPVGSSEQTRRQSIRCYTPADLLLLLESSPLKLIHAEFGGEAFDPQPLSVSMSSPLLQYQKDYSYSVVLAKR
jgi:SAM-dependent methyltransferase